MTNKLPKLTVSQVIKLFTTVPKDFVDDFFSLYDPKDPSDFIVNLETLSKWLNVEKRLLVRTLRQSYNLNQDYIETNKPKSERTTKYGGNHRKEILLSADCMKRLCMKSRSEKAEMVRTYFIEIEEFMFHYNDQIVDGLMRDIKKLQEKNIKKKKPDGPGVLYIIKTAEGFNKPGSTNNMMKRLATYNTGRLDDVEVLYVYKTEFRKEVERCIKQLMVQKRYKKRREIYEVDADIIQKLIRGCANLSMKLHYEGETVQERDGQYYMIFTTDIPLPLN